MIADLRFAFRQLFKTPGFSLIAIGTLALGIGANTAIFSVIDAVLLRSLAFPEAPRLVSVAGATKALPDMAVSFPDYLDLREGQKVFTQISARMPAGGVITGIGEPERVFGRFVTASFFPTLGMQPQIGRFFTEIEDRAGGAHVMVISDALWRRRFDADPAVVGRAVNYNGESWTILGVLPRNFEFYGRTNPNNDLFLPLACLGGRSFMADRGSRNLRVVARLAPGVTMEQARVAMASLAKGLAERYPATNTGVGLHVRSFLDDFVGDSRPALLTASVGAVLVLLIACANLANLTFVRGTARMQELAVRMAIGSSRLRLVRLLLAESLLVAGAGGGLGLLLGLWLIDLFKIFGSDIVPRIDQLTMDFPTIALSIGMMTTSAIVFGLLPAIQIARFDLQSSIKLAGSQTGTNARRSTRRFLVVAELTIALTLLITAGLLMKSFWRLTQVTPGFAAENVLTFRLRLPDAKYPGAPQAMRAVTEARQRLSGINGVQAVSVASGFPLGRASENSYRLEGQPEPVNASEWPSALALSIDENYFRALGVTLLAGRIFRPTDNAQSPPVVIVDEEFVRRHFGGQPQLALGRRLRFSDDDEPWRQIVGVVRHVMHYGLEEQAAPEIYRAWTQMNPRWSADFLRAMDLVVKTSGTPGAFLSAIKHEVRAIDADVPLGNVQTLSASLHDSTAARRLTLYVIGAFAFLAVVLSAVGLYGVASYGVGQRTREFGIRMAVGARPRDILRLVMSEGLIAAAVGAFLGLTGAVAISRLLATMLFRVSATDLFIYTASVSLLFLIALAACLIPARRAATLNPVTALRAD